MTTYRGLVLFLVALLSQARNVSADTITSYAAMGASWTDGLGYTDSWVPSIELFRNYEFGGILQPYNFASGGATSASLLQEGQHLQVRDVVQSNAVDLAFLAIGGNDFNEAAEDIASGALSGLALEVWANGTVSNILTAVDTVLAANPAGMVVWSLPDMTLVPAVRDYLSTPDMLSRSVAAIDLVNSTLKPEIVNRGIVFADVAQLMRDLDASPPVIGGVAMDMVTPSADPDHYYLGSLHPGAVANGILGNLMIEATNIGYGTGTPLMSDYELLLQAQNDASYVGETSTIDYASYIHVAPNHVLAVASTNNASFLELDALGNGITVGHSPELLRPLDVAHDASNNRYVVDAALSRIVKYDVNGGSSVFADITDGLFFPTSIEFDGNGNLYAVSFLNNDILRFDTNGIATLVANEADGVQAPFGLAIDPSSGNLFIAETDSKQIVMIDAEGNLSVFADQSDGLLTPVAVKFGNDGFLYVADAALSKIFKFDSLGNKTVFADITDGLFFPVGLAFDEDGFLYVSNYVNEQILRIDPNGVATVYATSTNGISGPFGLDVFLDLPVFNTPTTQAVTAVPEANSLLLVLVGMCTMLAGLRRWLPR